MKMDDGTGTAFVQSKEAYEEAHQLYWAKFAELEQYKRRMERARDDMQRTCVHEYEKDWSSRGRSCWECKHCGKLR